MVFDALFGTRAGRFAWRLAEIAVLFFRQSLGRNVVTLTGNC